MLKELTDRDKDIFMAVGFLETWLTSEPAQVKENLGLVSAGVKEYRQLYVQQQELNVDLQTKYNDLTAVSAGYLAEIQNLRQQMEELLVETQRPTHRIVNENHLELD